jgi:hypothetical protein
MDREKESLNSPLRQPGPHDKEIGVQPDRTASLSFTILRATLFYVKHDKLWTGYSG